MDVKTLSPIWPGGKKHACNGCGRMKTHQAPGAHTPEACFSVCGLLCGQRVDHLSLLSQNTTKRKEKSPFSYEKGDFLELLGGFEPPTSSLPTAMVIFFTYFSLIYSRFCSISFALRHSLQLMFPCVPCLSVAGYVVRKIVATKEALHMNNKALCSSLAFRPVISPFVPIDFYLLFWYCVGCKSPTKYGIQEEKHEQHEKTYGRRTDSRHPRNRPHHPRHSDSSVRRIHPSKQLQRQYLGGRRP
ncbi:unknown [Oscillibacter sp. CAG:155]|nr:unknown [Oscillibacter sp. CAG:155]